MVAAASTHRFPSPPDLDEPLIRICDVNHYFGEGEARKQVLFDNNLAIMPGEIVIMTGPSGSGKTTLLTLIGALRTVQEGTLEVRGQNLAGMTAEELVEIRRSIGFIFQAHNLFSSLTAYQNVRMALQLQQWESKAMHERAMEMLTAVGLSHRVHYKPGSLSGGQRQRVAIARALSTRPKIILADEPTAALDAASGKDVVELMKKLVAEERCSILIVTHDNRILDAADRIVNMVDGRIISNVLVQESVALCLFLQRCDAFKGLTADAITKVAEKMSKEKFLDGSVIIRKGDQGDKFYLLRHGDVQVVFDDDRAPIALGEGDFFGEMALLTGKPRNATVIARGQVETYSLGKDDFENAVSGCDTFKEQVYKAYFQRQ